MAGSGDRMPVKPLRSHYKPDLFLHEHIDQVFTAMRGIAQWHSDKLITPEIMALCRQLSRLHDLGKGSAAFQEYIKNPNSYSHPRIEKSHTCFSFFLTLALARSEKRDLMDTLLLSAAVYGHHKGLPFLPDRHGQGGEKSTLDQFASGRTLARQWASTDYIALEQATGIALSGIAPDKKLLAAIKRFMTQNIFPALRGLELEKAINFRLKTQLLFSILLEADKAFLAVQKPKRYLNRPRRHWQSAWITQQIGEPELTEVNRLRQKARQAVQAQMLANHKAKLYSLVAPTGIGKTLLAAEWALKNRELAVEHGESPSKVIVVLPYLSIIDQTAGVYQKLLRLGNEKADGTWLLCSHSLSSREYDVETERNTASFFIDTWRTELVITTYDQFLMSLIDPRAKYQMRFHNLCDSLIIMDEVQSVPCRLWQLLNGVLQTLTGTCASKILLMSATLPPFVANALPLLDNYSDYFKFDRYRFRFKIGAPMEISAFCDAINDRLPTWLDKGERVLYTLNTRRSARMVYDSVKKICDDHTSSVPVYFISADVTPKDRLQKIAEIKKGSSCVVVSTQCIEAGVDIDMSRIIRDFAPFDSLVQIAGRCNREGQRGKHCTVEIVELAEEKNGELRRYSEMIYDKVHLDVTYQIIGERNELAEAETLEVSETYFQKLNEAKDTGAIHLERFAYWREDIPVRELLRGEQKKQYTFLVIEQDETLLDDMQSANNIENRWERREAWRKLAGRIASVSVSVIAKRGFKPEEIARSELGHYILFDGYYDSASGLQLESKYTNNNVILMF